MGMDDYSLCLSLCLCLSVCLCLSRCLSLSLSLCLCLSLSLSVCLSLSLSLCLSVSLSIYVMYVCISTLDIIYIHVAPSLALALSLAQNYKLFSLNGFLLTIYN